MYLIDERMYKDSILPKYSSQMSQNNYIYTNQNITRPSTDSNLGFLPPNNKSHEKSQDMGKHNENNLEKIIEEDATYNTNPDKEPDNALKKTQPENSELQDQNATVNDDMNTPSKNEDCDCMETDISMKERSDLKRNISKKKENNESKKRRLQSDSNMPNFAHYSTSPEANLENQHQQNNNEDENLSSMLTMQSIIPQEPNPKEKANDLVLRPPKHIKTEENAEFIFCTYCSKKFRSQTEQENHMLQIHPDKRSKKILPVLEGAKGTVSFLCTICNSRFKRFQSLSRHMSNIHPDFFVEWNRKNKRPHEDNNATTYKKPKWDGRLKRPSPSTHENEKKKSKIEFKCFFCDRYFRSKISLDRHERNIHRSAESNGKRKREDSNPQKGFYEKRLKVEPKPPVQYSNYF